jgi:hypothetical protein
VLTLALIISAVFGIISLSDRSAALNTVRRVIVVESLEGMCAEVRESGTRSSMQARVIENEGQFYIVEMHGMLQTNNERFRGGIFFVVRVNDNGATPVTMFGHGMGVEAERNEALASARNAVQSYAES